MRRLPLLASTAVVLLAIVASPRASAEESYPFAVPEFQLGVGYANIGIGGELDDMNAVKVDGIFSVSPFANTPQLRVGGGASLSFVLDDSERALIVNNGSAVFIGSSEMPFILFQPEVRVSWRQPLGKNGDFFIEPGLGAGAAWGFLNLESDTLLGDDYDDDELTWQAKAFLYIGWRVPGGLFGVELSYTRGGEMDFAPNASGEVEEFFIGVFGSLQF